MEGPPTKRQKRQQYIVLSSDDEDAAADGGGPAGASACADDAALARRLQEREEMKARLASEEAATKRFLERDRARQHGPTAGPGLANGGSTHSGAAAHRNSIAVAVRAPPASARWVGQLDPKHTDPQPLPGQTLTYRQKDWPPHKWEVRTSDEIFTPFEVPAALAQAEVEVYQVRSKDICVCNPFGQFRRRDWHRTGCASCVELELRSGDLLLFKGNPAHDVAHGALDTVADTGPEDMPTWAQGCRVSMQYRVRMPTGPPARGWKQTGGGH